MGLPEPLPQVLIRESYGNNKALRMAESIVGGTDQTNPATANLPTGDPEFDKVFLVRAEDPNVAQRILPKATRDLLRANIDRTIHYSLHVWTWDRFLFTLETRTLSTASLEERLPLMAAIIENYSQS